MKDKTTAGILALLLGWAGVHKFYLGQTGMGIVYLVFCWTIVPWILGIIEGIAMLTMTPQDFNARYNGATSRPMVLTPGVAVDAIPQLRALHDLKIAGALTDEEFAAQKKKLLG